MDDAVRKNVEQIVKDFSLNRDRVFEVSKQSYDEITKKIEHTFVAHGGTIHWANMGNFKPNIPLLSVDCSSNTLWFEKLDEMIPPQNAVYVLLEEYRQNPKYWLYEMHLEELKVMLRELEFLKDYHIVSKKYDWLISENHHGIVSFVGDKLNLSSIKELLKNK